MKNYEKPALMVLSLSGNEQLCGTCADKGGQLLSHDPGLAGWLMQKFPITDKTGNGPSRDDFAGVFGDVDTQCTGVKIDNYCKFQSTGEMLVAWS